MLSQSSPATAKRRTIVGPRPDLHEQRPEDPTICTAGISTSGGADRANGRKLAPHSMGQKAQRREKAR